MRTILAHLYAVYAVGWGEFESPRNFNVPT
jgi:hypothetical protein